MSFPQAKSVRARIERSPHRSPTLFVAFDISPAIEADLQGEDLERFLTEACERAVRQLLLEGRRKVKNHP